MSLNRWIGAGIGWVIGVGPIGAVIGAALGYGAGSLLDEFRKRGLLNLDTKPISEEDDFILSMIVLASAVIKADGKVDKHELAYVRTYLADYFGNAYISDYIYIFEQVLPQQFNIDQVCKQISSNSSYESRVVMLEFLFGIAAADYDIADSEVELIQQISNKLGIDSRDFQSVAAMHLPTVDGPYKILELKPSASDAEVKAAYRAMLQKFHPDKVAHIGEGAMRAAREQFDKIQKAYEQIKKERGF